MEHTISEEEPDVLKGFYSNYRPPCITERCTEASQAEMGYDWRNPLASYRQRQEEMKPSIRA